jgi:hypothetical protein
LRAWRISGPLLVLVAVTACSPSPPPPPVDQRPVGNVTTPPLECGVVSTQAIARVLGYSEFRASGSTSADDFSHCIINRLPEPYAKAPMSIELYNPFDSTVDSLEYTKAKEKGADLPNDAMPGYSAPIKDADGSIVGAKALAWTTDGTKLLSIYIARGAPGRDHRADVIEFARQLRLLLLA